MQFRELERAGLHHLQDPKQLILMKSQVKVVHAVLSGDIDVGFIRTDQLERTTDSHTGELVDPSKVKIIRPIQGLTSDGADFPFDSSTPLYPEWNLAGLAHVPEEVRRAVQTALWDVNDHAGAATPLQECFDDYGCAENPNNGLCQGTCYEEVLDAGLVKSCDTTADIALAAKTASTNGKYAGWRSSESYMELRNMQEQVGFIRFDEETNTMRCNRDTELSDAVVCPDGYFKRNPHDIENACEEQGLPCFGFKCLCKPCVKAFDVDFLPMESRRNGNQFVIAQNYTAVEQVGCEKFSYCGSVEQGGRLTFQARDNKKRENAAMEAVVLVGTKEEHYSMEQIEENVYLFDFSAAGRGTGSLIVEVFLDGEPIPESPFRFEVIPRDCELDTGDELREPNKSGECVCNSQSVELFGSCVAFHVLLPSLIAPFLILMALLACLYAEYKKRQADLLWKVDIRELDVGDSPHTLGKGSFGVVVLAQFRGTTVAVKRMHDVRVCKGSKDMKDLEDPEQPMPTSSPQAREKDVGMISGMYSCEDFRDIISDNGDIASDDEILSSDDDRTEDSKSVSAYSSDLNTGSCHLRFGSDDGKRSATSQGVSRKSEKSGKSSKSKMFSVVNRSGTKSGNNKEFIKEMRHLSKLRHPNITTVMGAVLEKGKPPMLIMGKYCIFPFIPSSFSGNSSAFSIKRAHGARVSLLRFTQ